MSKVFLSPGRYVQGPGELVRLGEYVRSLGDDAVVIISAGGRRRFGETVEGSLAAAGISSETVEFNGECSRAEIDRLVALVQKRGSQVVIGVGGGKIFDTAKETADAAGLPVVIVPTIAATDAPCSSCSVIYTEEGAYSAVVYQRRSPALVLVDSDVVSRSPMRLTVSGMGDALATFFEARAVRQSNALTPARGKITGAAYALATYCYQTLLADGVRAKRALEVGARTEAVERIIEANTLASGLGFESGGLAAAHAVHNGLTVLPETHGMYHGEKVAFGTIVQLVLEDAPELDEVIAFCKAVGLPTTFARLGIEDASYERILAAARVACDPADTMANMPVDCSPELVAQAMIVADALGR